MAKHNSNPLIVLVALCVRHSATVSASATEQCDAGGWGHWASFLQTTSFSEGAQASKSSRGFWKTKTSSTDAEEVNNDKLVDTAGIQETGAAVDVDESVSCRHVFVNIGIPAADTVNAFIHTSRTGTPLHIADVPPYRHFDPANPRVTDFDYQPLQAEFQAIFRKTNTTYQDFCIQGIEANEGWASFFEQYMDRYRKCVRSMSLRAGVMVSDIESLESDFQCSHVDPEHGEFGDGQPYDPGYPCKVESVRVSSLLDKVARTGLETLILKMDIEGADVLVWRDLMQTEVLCQLRDSGVHVTLFMDRDHGQSGNLDTLRDSTIHKFQSHCERCGAVLVWFRTDTCPPGVKCRRPSSDKAGVSRDSECPPV